MGVLNLPFDVGDIIWTRYTRTEYAPSTICPCCGSSVKNDRTETKIARGEIVGVYADKKEGGKIDFWYTVAFGEWSTNNIRYVVKTEEEAQLWALTQHCS